MDIVTDWLVKRNIIPRQDSSGNAFLDALQKQAGAQPLGAKAAISSLVLVLVVGTGLTILFCIVRPHNSVVYAPRAKYADSKHAPPPVQKGLFAWLKPLFRTKEPEMVERVGLDAVVFLRVSRMMAWMFMALSVLGVGILIPVNVIAAKQTGYFSSNSGDENTRLANAFQVMTPSYLYMAPNLMWAYVVVAYLFDIVIIATLWWNYRAIVRLRRNFFDSPEYRQSLHARTLMVTDIPKDLRTDDGIARVTDAARATTASPRGAIARSVKDLPELVEEHDEAVRDLEKVLAKYLRDPNKIPAKRPTCKVHRKDKSHNPGARVDAIEYLTARIAHLAGLVRDVRESVDKRNALSFGFASYPEIPDAHSVAYATRNKAPNDTTIALAPQPTDLIWKNLSMTRSARKWQNTINGIWIAALTVLFIVPNILIAVFLSNLSNLGTVWPAFATSLQNNTTFWAIVQGILSPAISFLIYFFLPIIFRRLRVNAGDTTKSSRERHVTRALYAFFVLNQFVVVSFFSVAWTYIASLIAKKDITQLNAGSQIVGALSQLAPYWVSYMLQRNLGASIDLIQLIRLTYGSFLRKFFSPTPREQIEASAPQPFDYASYYNALLFYGTIGFVMAPISPILLLIAAVYFFIDTFVKKYMLLYIFITKHESGGMFWRTIFNRILVFTVLGNLVIVLVVVSLGFFAAHWPMLAALAPLPFVLVGFKFYCVRAFDDQIHYYQQGRSLLDSAEAAEGGVAKLNAKAAKRDKVSVRFGNPVLYKPLITPMVSAKSQHLLKSIYSGRTSLEINPTTNGSYGDVYMDDMNKKSPGKTDVPGAAGFEIVGEHEMDFEHFKNRAEFRDAAGGDGQLFGHARDLVRPGTPSSTWTGLTRTGTMDSGISSIRDGHFRDDSGASSSAAGGMSGVTPAGYHHTRDPSRASSRGSDSTRVGGQHGPYGSQETEYPRGYHQTPSNALREHSPAPSLDFADVPGFSRPEVGRQESRDGLITRAAGMGLSHNNGSGAYARAQSGDRDASPLGIGAFAAGSRGMPGVGAVEEEETSYDYYRGRAGRPSNGQAPPPNSSSMRSNRY